MHYNTETEILLRNIDIHQFGESDLNPDKTVLLKNYTSEFKLEIDDGESCQSYILNGDRYDIGRDVGSSIVIPNYHISGHHAILKKIPSKNKLNGFTYQIKDGNDAGKPSTNGIYVNNHRVQSCDLESGDIITFGNSVKAVFVEIPSHKGKDNSAHSVSPFSKEAEVSYSIIDPFVVLDIDGKILEFNTSAKSKLGFDSKEILGHKLADLIFIAPWKDEFKRALSRFSLTHDNSTLGRWSNVDVKKKNGDLFNAEVSVNSVHLNETILLTVTIKDVTTNNIKKSQILNKIYEDSLTRLGNRRYFLKRLDAAFSDSREGNKDGFAVLFVDLDRFKTVNDTLGHNIGDKLLIEVANRLKECLRETDTIARQGGDEFTVLLEGEDVENSIIRIACRLSDSLNQPYTILNHELVVTASIGVLLSSDHYENTEEMLRDADFAMYRAKTSGKGKYIIFDPKFGEQASQSLRIEKDLRYAIENKELYIDYQPIISLSSGKLTSFEALIRWNHPKLGFISPAEFIPIAENTGSIVSIGRWVLQQACKQIKLWQVRYQEAKNLGISVNLSIKQIEHPSIVEDITAILKQTNLDPKHLKIEITESLLMENIQDAVSKLNALRKLGIQVYIDDFGTGYSSFGYLHALPINALKIDRSFVGMLDSNNSGTKITQSIISLARVLGLEVIAEGVENMEQLNHLFSMKCDKVQGYYFSKPLNVEYAEVFITNHLT